MGGRGSPEDPACAHTHSSKQTRLWLTCLASEAHGGACHLGMGPNLAS